MSAFPAENCPCEYSEAERRWLLRLAQLSVRAAVIEQALAAEAASEHLREKRGAFVSLYKDGRLRGCIGRVAALTPLDQTIREMARAAALEDPRFVPVMPEELDRLQIEISVLSPMREVSPNEVVVGRDGLLITYNGRRGLLLPQVAVQWKWSREIFLAQTCMKAGLAPDQWLHGAKIEAFTAEIFGEHEPCESLRE